MALLLQIASMTRVARTKSSSLEGGRGQVFLTAPHALGGDAAWSRKADRRCLESCLVYDLSHVTTARILVSRAPLSRCAAEQPPTMENPMKKVLIAALPLASALMGSPALADHIRVSGNICQPTAAAAGCVEYTT